jgi:hypothetical protein
VQQGKFTFVAAKERKLHCKKSIFFSKHQQFLNDFIHHVFFVNIKIIVLSFGEKCTFIGTTLFWGLI